MLMPYFLAHSGLHPDSSLCGIDQWMLSSLASWPESVEACSTHWNVPPEIKDKTAPLASIVTYRFAADGDRPEVMLRWYDGGMMPALPC